MYNIFKKELCKVRIFTNMSGFPCWLEIEDHK